MTVFSGSEFVLLIPRIETFINYTAQNQLVRPIIHTFHTIVQRMQSLYDAKCKLYEILSLSSFETDAMQIYCFKVTLPLPGPEYKLF